MYYYAVLRIRQWKDMTGDVLPFMRGVPMSRPEDGSMGFIPVFEDLAGAEAASDGGKYQVLAVTVRDPPPDPESR